MRAKRIELGHIAFYTSSWKEYFGALLCNIGLHDIRKRKNGKRYDRVCKRKHCEYCKKEYT